MTRISMPQTLQNIELRKKTTLRLGGIVPFFYDIRTEEALCKLPELSKQIGMEIRILGGGSNILAADESLGNKNDILNFSVAQIQINYNNEETFEEAFIWKDDMHVPPLAKEALETKKNAKALRVEVGAGMPIPKLLKLCTEKGCTGLEGLMGIPGRVGGAIAMNAGAYQCEIDQVLETVRIYTKKEGLLTLTREHFKNAYRSFTPFHNAIALENYIICGATFVFPVVEREEVKAKIQENLIAKKKTQPIKAFTAGCVFKNPIHEDGTSMSAGKLLEEAGFRGKELNGMRFSPKHANFLENFANGNTNSALELIKVAQEEVFSCSNVKLEREIKLWL